MGDNDRGGPLQPIASAGDARAGTPFLSTFPVPLVDELDRLTDQRARKLISESRDEVGKRQRRIDELATELKARPLPGRGDEVLGVRLDRIRGRGGVSAVWQGVDLTSGEARAVKLFDTHLFGRATALHRFRAGVRTLIELSASDGRPPSIVRIHAVDDARIMMITDWLPGGDLTTTAKRGLSRSRKLQIFESICHGVRFAHERGVVHGGLKPSNVLFGSDGQAVITDFDLVDSRLLLTVAARVALVTVYAAPEERAESVHRVASTDIFSLGQLLHFLLAERDPLPSLEEVPILGELIGKPQGLIRIIRRCTLRDPTQRYPTVLALLDDLHRHEEQPGIVGVGAVAERPRRAPPVRVEPAPVEGRSLGRPIGIGVVAVAVLGVAVVGARTIDRSTDRPPRAALQQSFATRAPLEERAEPTLAVPSGGAARRAAKPDVALPDMSIVPAHPNGTAVLHVASAADGNATGAIVFVDEKNVGAVPCDLTLATGAHTVEVKRNGFLPYRESISLEDEPRTMVASLTVETFPAAITIDGRDCRGADVYVDGVVRGRVPTRVGDLEEGDHLVEVRFGTSIPWQRTLFVAAGSETALDINFTFHPHR